MTKQQKQLIETAENALNQLSDSITDDTAFRTVGEHQRLQSFKTIADTIISKNAFANVPF